MIPKSLLHLIGVWSGTKRVWMSPGGDAHESRVTATVAHVAKGHFLSIHYSWAHESAPQEGLLLIGASIATKPGGACGSPGADESGDVHVQAVWADSWHMGHSLMMANGIVESGGISAVGTYGAPPGPDWGWRIAVRPLDETHWRLTMYNVPPGEPEVLAVDVAFER
jgi:hypothetical protein